MKLGYARVSTDEQSDNAQLDAPKSRGNPKDMYAYKMDNIFRDTKVKEISWQLSKDNKWKPVIIVEKTQFPDVVVNRLTGKNAKFIESNKIGKGAVIKLYGIQLYDSTGI